MSKKIIIGLLIILICLVLYFFLNLLFIERERDLGDLTSSCNKKFKINITHSASFETDQRLSFDIKKNDSIIIKGGVFGVTNNADENLSSFELHCHKETIYVTWEKGSYPLIIYNYSTKDLWYSNGNQNKKMELFKSINKLVDE